MKIYIVSFQSKENMKLSIQISGRESSGDGVGTTGGGGHSSLTRSACAEEEGSTGFPSAAFDCGAGLFKASLWHGCPGFVQKCLSEPVGLGVGGSCFLFSAAAFTQKTTKKPQNQALWCPGHGPAGCPTEAGLLAGLPPPRQLQLRGDEPQHMHAQPRRLLCSHRRHHCCLQFFAHHVFSAHGRYQKFQSFKAVSVFSVYVGIL